MQRIRESLRKAKSPKEREPLIRELAGFFKHAWIPIVRNSVLQAWWVDMFRYIGYAKIPYCGWKLIELTNMVLAGALDQHPGYQDVGLVEVCCQNLEGINHYKKAIVKLLAWLRPKSILLTGPFSIMVDLEKAGLVLDLPITLVVVHTQNIQLLLPIGALKNCFPNLIGVTVVIASNECNNCSINSVLDPFKGLSAPVSIQVEQVLGEEETVYEFVEKPGGATGEADPKVDNIDKISNLKPGHYIEVWRLQKRRNTKAYEQYLSRRRHNK